MEKRMEPYADVPVTTKYFYDGTRLVYEKRDRSSGSDENIWYYYDASGDVVGFELNNVEYYYVKNLQGDVVQIVDKNNTVVVEYTYEPFGGLASMTGSLKDTVGVANPIRYRSYYFDDDMGFYYLNSRYYDPKVGRFLNADRLIDEGAGLQGVNLFQYCGNNPINNFDPTGQFFLTISACIAIGSVVVGALAFGHTAATSYKYTGSVDWGGSLLNGFGWGLTAYTFGMSAYGVYTNYSYCAGKTPVTSVSIGKTPTPQLNYPPNNGFNSTPRNSTLSQGSTIQRSGGAQGKFVAPVNTPLEKLSLPPDKINAPVTNYTILKPIQVQAGTAVPWFGQSGGGTQFLLPDSIANLQKNGYLEIFPK